MGNLNISVDDIVQAIVDFLPRLGLGIAVLLIARLISSWVARIVTRSLERREADPELIVLIRMMTQWGILALGVVLALEQIAPGQFSSLIAGLGIAGFTLGFALQDVAKNFIAGILLLIQQPFDLGDTIKVSEYSGTVSEISLRTTELRTLDGLQVIIPNGEVFVSSITNYSRSTKRRIELTLGVAYETNLQKVIELAIGAVQDISGVLSDPAPFVIFNDFGDSAISISLFYWVDVEAVGYGDAKNTGMEKVLIAFQREGIHLPFPTMSVKMDSDRADPRL